MVVSPEKAVNYMHRCSLSCQDNWLRRYRFSLVSNFLPLPTKHQSLLDFGCGDGLFLKHLLEHNHSLSMTGYDPYYANDENNITGAVKIFKSLNDIGPQQFDVVCALEVIEHIKNDAEALQQLHKLLKPRGTLLLTVPAYQLIYSRRDVASGHYRRYSRSSLSQLLTKTGFAVFHYTHFLSFLIPVAFALKYYLLIRHMWRKDDIQNIPIDPMKIFSTLARIEHKFMRAHGFSLPCGMSILVAARKEQI